MTERRLPYGLLWILFLACMFAGAALLVAGKVVLGAGMLLLPLVGAGVVTLAYYVLERRHAKQ